MKRRTFVKALPLAALPLLPGCGTAPNDAPQGGSAQEANAQDTQARKGASGGRPSSGGSQDKKAPDWSKDFLTSDMQGLGSDGKPTGQKATFTGASKANATAEEAAKHQMKLTKEEQAILDGSRRARKWPSS